MSEPMRIDLEKMVKAINGKSVNFLCHSDGEVVEDRKAREVIAAYIAEGHKTIPMRVDDTPVVERPKENSTYIGRVRKVVEELHRERVRYMREHSTLFIPDKLKAKIAAAEEELKEAEAYEPKRLSRLLPEDSPKRRNLINSIIKMHIAADYLTETAMDTRENLDRLGFRGCNLFPMVEAIEKKASEFAGMVCHPEFAGLQDFMTTNADLLDEISLLVTNYMNKNLKEQ